MHETIIDLTKKLVCNAKSFSKFSACKHIEQNVIDTQLEAITFCPFQVFNVIKKN